jgi:hypothetical protein
MQFGGSDASDIYAKGGLPNPHLDRLCRIESGDLRLDENIHFAPEDSGCTCHGGTPGSKVEIFYACS